MAFPRSIALVKILTLTGVAGLLAGCNSGSVSPAPITPQTTFYGVAQTATWTGFPPASGAASFDISFVDPTAHQYYVADRTSNGVSVIDTQTMKYVSTAGQGLFAGVKPGVGGAPSTISGPNGIVPVGGGVVFAGDGDGSMKVVNVNSGALLATINPVNPYAGSVPLPASVCSAPGTPTSGAANQRMDEMAYDPTDGVVLGINDASCPPFGTFFSAKAPYAAIGTGIAFATATGGAEQPTWDPAQKQFIMALPSTIANPGGEIDLIDPNSHLVTKTFAESGNCNANGTALGQNETLFLGCSSPGILLTINAVTGATINTIANVGGCDEVWYNPTANRFYAACSNNKPSPVVAVVDGTGNLISTFATSTGAHSVAVDPTNDHVYVPTQKLGVQIYATH
jgi:YVTN family beta-propeller protein